MCEVVPPPRICKALARCPYGCEAGRPPAGMTLLAIGLIAPLLVEAR